MNSKKDELRPEYSSELIKSGVRGKFTKQYREGTNIVLLDPDVAKAFPNSQAVNDALRRVIADQQKSDTTRS